MERSSVSRDIQRLENRMRTNFFEIEKRLTEMENKSSFGSLEEVRERINEIEDLQMLMQSEYIQLKEKVLGEGIEIPEADIQKRVEKLEQSLSKGVEVEVDEDIETRVEKLEKSTDIKKLESLYEEFEKKMKDIEERKSVPEKPDTSIFAKKMGEIEERIKGLKKPEEAHPEIAKKMGEIEEKIKGLKKPEEIPRDIEKRIDEIRTTVKENEKYFNRKVSELHDALESSGKVLTEDGMKRFINRISEIKNGINKRVEEFEETRERLDKLLKQRQELIERIEQSDVNVSKADALLAKIRTEGTKVQSGIEKAEALNEKIDAVLKDKIGEMETLKLEVFDRTKKIGEKINAEIEKSSSIREDISIQLQEVEKGLQSIDKLDSHIEETMKNIDAEFSKKAGEKIRSLNEIAEQINSRTDASKIDKRFREIENMIRNRDSDMKNIKDEIHRISTMEEMSDKTSIALNEKLKENIKGTEKLYDNYSEIARDIKDLKAEVDNKISNFEKDVESKSKYIDTSFREVIDEIEKRVAGIDATINSKIDSKVSSEIKGLEDQLNQGIKGVNDSRTEINSRINSMEKETNERMSKLEESVANKIDSRLSSSLKNATDQLNRGLDEMSKVRAGVENTANMLRKETGERLSRIEKDVENRVDARTTILMKDAVDDIRKEAEQAKKTGIELRAMAESAKKENEERLKALEKELESKAVQLIKETSISDEKIRVEAVKVMNEYLKKFSALFDERLNETIPRRDFTEFKKALAMELYTRLSKELVDEFSKKVSEERSCNIEAVINKLSVLESQLATMQKYVRGFSVKVPTILE